MTPRAVLTVIPYGRPACPGISIADVCTSGSILRAAVKLQQNFTSGSKLSRADYRVPRVAASERRSSLFPSRKQPGRV